MKKELVSKLPKNYFSWAARLEARLTTRPGECDARSSNIPRKIIFWQFILLFFFFIFSISNSLLFAEEKESWMPDIYIYQPPIQAISTSTVFRSVDPQIIQKIIDLLEEPNLGKLEAIEETPSLKQINSFITPQGFELKNRYTRLGVVLSESLGWEEVKHIRVISEQNLKQRLTTVARWEHSPNVRSIALIALASLKDKNDLVYFKEALWSRNIGIRFATIEALVKWNLPESIELLQEIVQRDESKLARVFAEGSLALLGHPNGLKSLRENLENRDWLIRAFSAKFIGEFGAQEDYDLLLDQLNREQTATPNEFVITEIAIAALKLFPQKLEKEKADRERKALEKKKKKGNVVPPQNEPQTKKETLLKKRAYFELDPLIVTAPRLRIPEKELVDSRINFQLLKIVQEKEDFRVTQEMIDQSTAYKDLNELVTPNGIRLKARYTVLGFLLTEGLAGTKDFQLQNELSRIAREGKNPDVRSFALIALAYSKERIHSGLFQNALRSEYAADRFAAVEAMEIWGYEEAISILIGVTKLDVSPIVRVFAAGAVLRMGNLMGKDILIRSLDDEDWVSKAMAMRALGELGGAADYPKLLSYFGSDQNNIVQAEMCSSLLRLHAKRFKEEGE